MNGQVVRSLLDTELPAGNHHLQWDGTDEQGRRLPTGIYLLELKIGSEVLRKEVNLQQH